jgi:hypothetical protein
LKTRYEHTGGLEDLTEAVRAYRESVEKTPDKAAELPYRLNNLDVSLRDRYRRAGSLNDLNAAVDNFRRAANILSEKSLIRPAVLTNLGDGLRDSGDSGTGLLGPKTCPA